MSNITVLGDNLLDIYLEGNYFLHSDINRKRFKPKDKKTFPGGAKNLFYNLKALLAQYKNININFVGNSEPIILYRLKDLTKDFFLETYTEPIDINTAILENDYCLREKEQDILIISDYNKGTVNKKPILDFNPVPIVIVDSRYRSTHKTLIDLGLIKIWRCTGGEWDSDWAKQFDFIVYTDAEKDVYLLDNKGINIQPPIKVPTISPIDTCGAGDTFTAALAGSLLLEKEQLFMSTTNQKVHDIIYKSLPICIEAAQDVCMKEFTAITSIKL